MNVFADAIDGLRLLFAIPVVRTLLIVAVVVEVFGFAYVAVMPAMARDALGVEEGGLGALTMMAGFGGLAGVGVLALLGDFQRKGSLLVGVAVLSAYWADQRRPGSTAVQVDDTKFPLRYFSDRLRIHGQQVGIPATTGDFLLAINTVTGQIVYSEVRATDLRKSYRALRSGALGPLVSE